MLSSRSKIFNLSMDVTNDGEGLWTSVPTDPEQGGIIIVPYLLW